MRRRLFWKILFAFWLTFVAITQGVWLLFELSRERRPPADAAAPALVAAVADMVSRSGPAGFEAFVAALPAPQRRRLTLLPGAPAESPGRRVVIRETTAPDGRHYTVAYGFRRPPSAAFRLNTPPELLLLGLAGGLLFSIVLAWYLTEPIHRLRQGFDQLARGNLKIRLAGTMGRRRDEIADLAGDFDRMAQRLEQLVAARDRLLHDVSHELRSPLARLQLATGLARQRPARIDASLDRIDREARRLDMLVGELLALARAENETAQGEDYFDPGDIVRSIVEDARFEAQVKDVTITLADRLPPEEERPALRGHAELVRRAMDNVVRNALRHSPDGEAVAVEMSLDADRGHYRIDVSDGGRGVPDAEVATIFDPFVRAEGDRGDGLGLGLAIARRAVVAHGGTIEARNREEGGLQVTIVLPVPDGRAP